MNKCRVDDWRQGKWQNTENEESFIEVKGHLYIDYYIGVQPGTTEFFLDRVCLDDPKARHPGNNERYLVQPHENRCWEIVRIDAESLEVSLSGKDRSAMYRKVN